MFYYNIILIKCEFQIKYTNVLYNTRHTSPTSLCACCIKQLVCIFHKLHDKKYSRIHWSIFIYSTWFIHFMFCRHRNIWKMKLMQTKNNNPNR